MGLEMMLIPHSRDEAKAALPPHTASTHGTAAQPSILLAITNVVDCCDLYCCHLSSWPTTTIIIVISILHLLASSFTPLLSCVPPPPSLSWKCRQHVATCRRQHTVSLQFWPDGSVSPTQNLRCRGSLCRLEPTFTNFSEVRM